ncbi:UPF0481 protein At3g47200-like [Prosopis cineraria]|uniref:UPF0481 protein At3g47200-like n=1 Tax=Prosopis cineraria TaxID=364024 RepID=UPI00240FDE1F|nr:UPF0481 protein At3g47200-like [Prosopis cineraria]
MITMAQDRYAQLLNHPDTSRSAWPKIQSVAHHLRSRPDFAQYYSPKMVSLGPIHHGEHHLKLGEQYKLSWAKMYVGDRNKARSLHEKIVVNIKDLKDLYTDEDAVRRFNDDELAWMLFVDGCALLQILKHPDILKAEPLNAKVDQLALVRQDALLLENQLPFQLLRLLSDLPSDTDLIKDMDYFLLCHHLSPEKPQNQNRAGSGHHAIDADPPPADPVHLLDELRRKVLRDFKSPDPQIKSSDLKELKEEIKRDEITYRNLKELKEAGIQVKRNKSKAKRPIDITFSSSCFGGELKFPDMIVDDTIAPTYLNLMAYEACPDFENKYEISSYVELLDSLIDHADDVKELRKAGVLRNCLGSDEEVAELFNVISKDLVVHTSIYTSLRAEIEKHYKKKCKTWFAMACNTYFSNPWSIIAFIAASAALLLTFIQTWFAAFPSHGNSG